VDADNKISQEEARELEEKTQDQSKTKKWFSARKFRLTASKFGEICKATTARDFPKMCETIYDPPTLQTKAILHGKAYEKTAIAQLQKKLGIQVSPAGLYVHPEFPFLGASPDGKVGENSVVEVKCPYVGRNKKIEPCAEIPYLEKCEGKVHLKRGHNYYYQIQGQLAISKKEKCYFVIYTFVDFFVEEITLDAMFFEKELVPKLSDFYNSHYRPFVASKL